jgi:hypothetical protein
VALDTSYIFKELQVSISEEKELLRLLKDLSLKVIQARTSTKEKQMSFCEEHMNSYHDSKWYFCSLS